MKILMWFVLSLVFYALAAWNIHTIDNLYGWNQLLSYAAASTALFTGTGFLIECKSEADRYR